MARDYIDLKNTGDSIPDWPSGTIRRKLLPDGNSCAYTVAQFNTQAPSNAEKVAQTNLDIPANLPDKKWQSKDCGLIGFDPDDTVFVRDPTYSGPADPTDPTDPSDPTPGNFGATTFFPSGNPNLLSIGHEWVMHDGEMKARIFNQANPTPPNGSSNFFYFCGFKNPDQGTFSERFIRPGTFCQVYIGQGPRKEIYHDGYPNKAQQQFWIGNPPTN